MPIPAAAGAVIGIMPVPAAAGTGTGMIPMPAAGTGMIPMPAAAGRRPFTSGSGKNKTSRQNGSHNQNGDFYSHDVLLFVIPNRKITLSLEFCGKTG